MIWDIIYRLCSFSEASWREDPDGDDESKTDEYDGYDAGGEYAGAAHVFGFDAWFSP